ncbi:hypothetical protein BGX28_009927 [Mortierella sp. GBA30]|nr:hypothetical protein BGX28_009927 [Mortierella sp. GBA30]
MGERDGVDCPLCRKRFKNKHTLQSHRIDIHDGDVGRLDILACPVPSCDSKYQSRSKFQVHLSKHKTSDDTHLCPRCDKTFASLDTLDKHLDEHENSQTQESPDSPSDNNTDTVQILKANLVSHTGSLHTAEFLMTITCPIVLTLDNSSKITILGIPNMREQLAGRRIVDAREIPESRLKVDDKLAKSTDADLSQALLAHSYGRIVMDELHCYEELDDETCHQRFLTAAQKVAKKLAGALIQSKASVLLVLKVEIYGRTRSEDPHEQPLAFPLLGSYIVESVSHDGAKKIMIGTDSWLALITSCIQLNTGEVIVGPHNTNFTPHKHSKVWVRTTDHERNTVVERHLRSKYHDAKTFMACAGVFFLFRRPACVPVTLRTLQEHYLSKAASGIKTLAVTFHQLYEDKALSQTGLAKQMDAIVNEQTRICRELQTLYQMLSTANDNNNKGSEDKDIVEVTEGMSRQLRILTEFTTSVITTLNHTVVKEAIQQRIGNILNEKA